MNPYKRIIRPLWQGHFGHDHILDDRYCSERQQLIHAYHILEKDFKELFDFVQLHNNNNAAFSHRIYELLLRASTEFENNCKGILTDNGYLKNSNLNITDYFKINQAVRLNEFEVRLNVWSPQPLVIRPFSEWSGATFAPLTWYQNYNLVKHDRSLNFQRACLDNLVKAMSGLFVILASQFYCQVFSQFQINDMTTMGGDNFASANDTVFSIKFPESWTNADFYEFDWNTAKTTPQPFQNYNFI